MLLKKYTVLLVSLIVFVQCFAQQEIILPLLETDTTAIELQRQAEYRQLVTVQIPDGFMFQEMEFPKFDFTNNFKNDYVFSFNKFFSGGIPFNSFSIGSTIPYFSPFYGNSTLLSQGAYQVNSKFVIGGYSYGINSPFSAPLPSSFEPFDHYGSTFFMQYKVGKNFKIETRINVSKGNTHPGF
jgi:hypothetical protein